MQFVLIELESDGSPGHVAVRGFRQHAYAQHDAVPVAVDTIFLVAFLIPSVDAEMHMVIGIQHHGQTLPPFLFLVAAIGDDDDLYLGLDAFEISDHRNEIVRIDGIAIVTAERYFLHMLLHKISVEVFPKEWQGQLSVDQAIGHFLTAATRTSQRAFAADLNVPVPQC